MTHVRPGVFATRRELAVCVLCCVAPWLGAAGVLVFVLAGR